MVGGSNLMETQTRVQSLCHLFFLTLFINYKYECNIGKNPIACLSFFPHSLSISITYISYFYLIITTTRYLFSNFINVILFLFCFLKIHGILLLNFKGCGFFYFFLCFNNFFQFLYFMILSLKYLKNFYPLLFLKLNEILC